MDLVKIGFLIKADGLKDANTEVEKLLNRVDKIGTSSKKNASEFENSQKKIKKTTEDSTKATDNNTKANDAKTKAVERTTKALERQRLIGEYLGQGLDKTTASAIASFKQLGGTTQQISTLMASLANHQGLVQAQKDAAKLARDQAKAAEDLEKSRQKRMAAIQNEYQKNMELAAKEVAAQKAAAQKAVDDAEKARQKKFSAVQKEYQQNMERLARQTAAEKAAQEKSVQSAEKARQLKFAAAQRYYQQQMELLARQTAAEKAAQEKAAQNAEKERQRQIAAAERQRQAELRGQSGSSTSRDVLGQIKGIAAYALLSTAIYGAMTATFNMIGATVRLADEYSSTQQRLKLYIKDSETLGQVNTFLAKSAIQNNVGLRENAALYAKLSPAMQKIGANTAATNQVVDAFGKSLRIGGATTMEAASATIQFAQAMASGKLAGDEFRAISEASPRFLKAIADGSGIAAEKLKEMSSEGALTTEVIARALVKEYHNLTKESESLGYTLEQGTNALKTGFMSLIGEFNEGAGITKYLGTLMAGMGVDMINTAESAKKSGEAFKEWLGENASTIQTVVDAIKLLAITVVSKYVASMVVAGAISLKTAYSLNVAALGATATQRAFGLAAIAAIRLGGALAALATPKNLFTLGLTVAGVAASYLLMRDNAAEATQKLVEQSDYVDITTEAYRKLNEEQQLNARSSVAKDMEEVNKKLDEQAKAVEGVLKSYVKSRQSSILGMDNGVTDVLDKVTKGVMSYDTALRLLSENKNVPRSIVEDFKKEKDIYDETAKDGVKYAEAAKIVGTSSELAGNKAQNATPLIAGLADETEGLGDKAEIAGSKVSKFALDLKKAIQDSKDTYDFMLRFDLDEGFAKKLVDRVNQNLAPTQGKVDKHIEAIEKAQKEIDKLDSKDPLKKSLQDRVDKNKALAEGNKKVLEDIKKAYAAADAPLVQQAQKEAERVSELSASRRKSDKEAAKSRKEATKDLEKFNDQLLESQTYYDILKRTNNLEVARIASQKEYLSIYKDNLAVATQIADMQEKTRKEESRQEYNKSLRDQVEQLSVIAGLTEAGADYETAKALAAAGFVNDAKGRAAAEKTIMNTLAGQSFALSDQITDQETLNRYLKEGMGLEEARFKVALSRVAKLSGGKNVYNQYGEDYENAMKSLRVKRATESSQIKINSILRESGILTKAMEMGYTASNIAVAKLSGATQGLLFSQAETQLKQQDELDLLYENAKARVKINSLLSGESEALRAVKEDYATIGDFEAERVVQLRQALKLAEDYNKKLEEQKANPLGDFSKVDFEVFGSFGNPFKEALDGLNSLISGSSKLDESLAIVAAQISELKAQAFVEDMFGNQTAVEDLNSQIEKQLGLEKDLQKQKAETNDIAYGQGLKFAKSFFKEESKGYKIINALEMALQAKKIAFALWEKKDEIAMLALKLKAHVTDALGFTTGAAAKLAAQSAVNVAKGTEAVLTQGSGDPYTAFPRMAAMAAIVAALGIAIGSVSGGSGGSFEAANNGTGTVFGDSEAKSASIANSIDLLSENSDLMLPLTSAMLKSLRNIESSIGGVTNLIVRQATGQGFNISEGFTQNSIGSFLEKAGNTLFAGIGDFLGINKMIGGFLGSLFGSKTTIKGQGLYGGSQDLGSILSQGFDLQEYVDVEVKKKSFGITTSTKNMTQFAEANKELEKQFTLIFGGFYDSILSATDILGANTDEVKKKLQDSVVSIGKIDLKGLNGEQIQEKLEAVFGAAADSLARAATNEVTYVTETVQQPIKALFGKVKVGYGTVTQTVAVVTNSLDDFQKVGEGFFETLVRVATGVEQASYYTDRLNVSAIKYTDILNKQGDVAAEIVRQSVLLVEGNKNIKGGFYDLVNTFDGTAEELSTFVVKLRDLQDQLFMTGKNADYLTSSMILGAGGLEGLSSGLDAYFEMLSPAEQAAELTRRLTNEFAIFGKELPADVKAFRNLVSGIDISTEAGQKLYGQIIALAPEFNDLQDSLKNANSEVNALVQSLSDLAEQARAARGETEQPRNLAYTRSQFEQASVLAMQGDTASAEKLLTLGKDLMGLSKTYSVTGSEYARDLALIQRAATVSADIQEQGLGTSISTTLTPSSGTSTTPTVNTTNSTMTSEMKTMREEFNAGLFAIAKYVQNLDSRTERWDDGNRVMVGVLSETGDQPIPVKVVP